MTNSYVVLVAFEVEANTFQEAQERLLPSLQPVLASSPFQGPAECWWVADDKRVDGSDNDSAVFVTMGKQPEASRLLEGHMLTASWNIVRDDRDGGQA